LDDKETTKFLVVTSTLPWQNRGCSASAWCDVYVKTEKDVNHAILNVL